MQWITNQIYAQRSHIHVSPKAGPLATLNKMSYYNVYIYILADVYFGKNMTDLNSNLNMRI